ncbi:MAG: PilZ domain-containing protein, partial [Pyrinomonadaceae bacterium]|nr:PilZ domain-containing protein [Pyrinomonadaceae bacterium]
ACPRNGKITSLSSRGCFVKTTAVATDGQTVFVNCWLPERRWMMLCGTVIYHIEKVGFGMIFTELNDERQATIHSLIEHYRDNPIK